MNKNINELVMNKEIYLTGKHTFTKTFNNNNKVQRDMNILNFQADYDVELIKMTQTINSDCVIAYFTF